MSHWCEIGSDNRLYWKQDIVETALSRHDASAPLMSAFGGKADMVIALQNVRF